jgi:hypothetical protein
VYPARGVSGAIAAALVRKTVKEILLRKLIGRTGEVAEKITDRVVVLTVRQSSQRSWSNGSLRGAAKPCNSGDQVQLILLCEMLDPSPKHGFFRTAFLDPLASRVRDAHRRLVQKQRLRWIRPVDKFRQLQSKQLDSFGLCLRRRELQAGRRRYAIVVVTDLAFGFFENWIHLLRKKAICYRGAVLCARSAHQQQDQH